MPLTFPFRTSRLILRSFSTRAGDIACFHAWRNDPEVSRYTLWDVPFSKSAASDFCQQMAGSEPFVEGSWYQVAIEEQRTGHLIGDIGVGNGVTRFGRGTATIGYTLARSAQRKGYATEAVRAMVQVLADQLDVSKFVAEIDARNTASARVLQKLGFRAGPVHVGRSFVKGEWCDEIDYELRAEELQRE